jgi:hypothetical protein
VPFDLSEEEMSAIDFILSRFTVAGKRHPDLRISDVKEENKIYIVVHMLA